MAPFLSHRDSSLRAHPGLFRHVSLVCPQLNGPAGTTPVVKRAGPGGPAPTELQAARFTDSLNLLGSYPPGQTQTPPSPYAKGLVRVYGLLPLFRVCAE